MTTADSNPDPREALRHIPSVAAVLADPELSGALAGLQPAVATAIVQDAVAQVRAALLSGQPLDPAARVAALVQDESARLATSRLAPVINGTGVIVHTNLGRAPVSRDAAAAMAAVAGHYTPLELELAAGTRGGRMSEIAGLMRRLTGAEATLVVNNNAAALLLVLSALCAGREVILSRGQAVEIGGGFRIPDVMAQSGARLVEVGTTNRSYARDYERAVTPATAALLTVHWSNFRIIGFTAQPSLAELAAVAAAHGLPLIEDLGSGAIADTAAYGLSHEPTIGESLAAGVAVVCASGDKLLGGPQAGIICGRRELVDAIATHPLARAVRADKTCLAGLAATLRHYLRGDYAQTVPVWRMLSASLEDLEARGRGWLRALEPVLPAGAGEIVPSQATVGGGSLPGETIESRSLAVPGEALARLGLSLDRVAERLRAGQPSLLPHLADGRLLVDARTVLPGQDEDVAEALRRALAPGT